METIASPTINWEPVCQGLVGGDLETTLKTAESLKADKIPNAELPLMLSALLPAVSTVLTSKANPTSDSNSIHHKIRACLLKWMADLPTNEAVHPHAPHLVAVAMDVLTRDYEDNAISASRILFNLFKSYRSLPSDFVQPYLDFVVSLYGGVPSAIERNFAAVVPDATMADASESSKTQGAFVVSSLPSSRPQFKSISSFRVLTECPLVVIFIIQLYPTYVENSTTIPGLIKVMMEALSQRPPTLHSLVVDADSATKRLYLSTVRDLVAAQAKTLSFLIYLLRTFTKELKPYENQLATNVVALIKTCPRESIGTRRELLVATRHLLNSEFRNGFFQHVDSFLDERVLTGNRSVVRPMAYQMLSDLIHHVRNLLSMKQMTRVVGMYCRLLHDASLPLSSQNAAVRTLLNLVETIYQNKDPDGQLGRDMLVRLLFTFVEKLESVKHQSRRETPADESMRDIPALIRIIIVGLKTIITFICGYRAKRFETMQQPVDRPPSKPGSNEEVASAAMKITETEASLIDRYCVNALPVMALICDDKFGSPRPGEKPLAELHRDALTYFAAAFTGMDGFNLRRTLGKRLDILVESIIDDSAVLVIPRHLLGNASTSLEFCGVLLDYLVDHMEQLGVDSSDGVVFFDTEEDAMVGEGKSVESILFSKEQRPRQSLDFLERRSTTLLQLFERVLKSLSSYPENETVIRKHLRFLVSTCLKLTMEKSRDEADKYCMLLRYLFRSISAGKFEESYKELLPLIPAVLNGLFRITCSSEASALRSTAIELCLTIPARLSSLLPHMNLLIRVIIPALDSDIGELINLGLRTLEFWVDNLNPLFLYPELSKQIDLFSTLMQSLLRHLRPAPYPYGLLTLRLLGKLGGKNRQFLRFPMELISKFEETHEPHFRCSWKGDTETSQSIHLPLPIESCVRLLRRIVLNRYDSSVLTKQTVDSTGTEDIDGIISSTLADQVAACFDIIMKAKTCQDKSQGLTENIFLGLLYSTMVARMRETAYEEIFNAMVLPQNISTFVACLATFVASSRRSILDVGVEIVNRMQLVFTGDDRKVFDKLVDALCDICSSRAGKGFIGPQRLILHLVRSLGSPWAERHQFKIVNATLLPVKSVPRELTHISVAVTRKFLEICLAMYGYNYVAQSEGVILHELGTLFVHHTDRTKVGDAIQIPSDAVFRLIAKELASPQQLTRFAAQFLLKTIASASTEESMYKLAKQHNDLIRQVLFSKSLRFLPLPQQVGLLEGLCTMVGLFPKIIPLEDQHLLACLSELLKMSSVADRDMEDSKLDGRTVDKDGFVGGHESFKPRVHCFSIFYRRSCAINISDTRLIVPHELPAPVQLRVSAVRLLHIVINAHESAFFDAESSTAIGSLRPHVVSLFFRSLVSRPIGAVDAAHEALRDILAMNKNQVPDGEAIDDTKLQPRLPKELLQNCIRPVLLNLKDHTRLSVPLLRGLSRLLSLLSSWFNKTLGEKLLDHLQQWADPPRIMSRKIWAAGEEPLVAAAIVGIFALLPQSSQFVEHLVKTCINLEAKLHFFKAAKYVESPFRRPLALYLNKHPQHAVSFFFPRLKTPMYSELFQCIIGFSEESQELRRYLSNRQRTQSILNVCYERPLAILRSEKTLTTGTSARNILALYGIKDGDLAIIPDDQRPMDIEALELQQQGFRMVQVLLAMDPCYFNDHFEIVRAFRFLWNSRGRLLRVQYEDMVSPRFQEEPKLLAIFLIAYANKASEDMEILFELSRAFLQPSAADFGFVSRYLKDRMSHLLPKSRKEILRLFFDFMSKESADELKVLGIQHLVRPLLESHELAGNERRETVEKFMSTVLFKDGQPIQCGERLRVELLQIANILLRRYTKEMIDFTTQLMKYCWGLLKSEDSIGKSWSFLVISRVISCSDTPSSKTILQTYYSLLRSHQQEGKELIRSALVLLLPTMTKKLTDEEKASCIKETNQMLHNDGNTSPQVAHVLKTIVDFPDFYKAFRAEFIHSIFTVLQRLNFSQNSPPENKPLAAETVSLLLNWDGDGEIFSDEQRSAVANFVIRFRLAMSEVSIENKSKELGAVVKLESMFDDILRETVSRWKPVLKPIHFEKLLSSDARNSNSFIAAMKILTITTQHSAPSMHREVAVIKDVVSRAIDSFWNVEPLRKCVSEFVAVVRPSRLFSHVVIAALEKEVDKGLKKLVEEATQRRVVETSATRGKDRHFSPDSSGDLDNVHCALSMLSDFCNYKSENFDTLLPSLLGFAKTISKAHLLDASTRQRHGASLTRASSTGVRHHTPTVGIVDQALSQHTGQSSMKAEKCERQTNLVSLLVLVLSMFESQPIHFLISKSRRELLQIIISVLDSSDDVQLIMTTIRVLGKFLLQCRQYSPLTVKERNSFLMRLATMDFCNIVDDASLQLVTGLVFDLVQQLMTLNVVSKSDEVFDCLISSSVLSARMEQRAKAQDLFFERTTDSEETKGNNVMGLLWRVLLSDYEGIGGRFWMVLIFDVLIMELNIDEGLQKSFKNYAHGNPHECLTMIKCLLCSAWKSRLSEKERLNLVAVMEVTLSRTYHFQFIRETSDQLRDRACSNVVRSFLTVVLALDPLPVLNTNLITSLAENYNCWHEGLSYFEKVYANLDDPESKSTIGSAIMHFYRQLGEVDLWQTWAKRCCVLPRTKKAMSFDTYGIVAKASAEFANLMEAAEGSEDEELLPSDIEQDIWEEKWLHLQREMCQFQVVTEFANLSQEPMLQLECAWKNQDWDKVRTLTSSPALFSAVESGNPALKLSETLLAVADGRLSDVENLHAQTAQLCLYRWQLLPMLATNSPSHSSLLHFFHRLIEIRESGQIMVETKKHASKRTLPDLKNLLNAWRHRLPNDWEDLSRWDEVFAWRSHMFSAITSNFNWCEPEKLAVIHDRPWTSARLAKTARKHGLRDTSLLLLSQNVSSDERAINVPDAFLKLREQILVYYNAESTMERHGGLNLINLSNLSYFDDSQKSELFRLKAVFLQSLQRRSKANQAFSNAVQICPTHARAWVSWGEWYMSLGSAIEKQTIEQNPTSGTNEDSTNDAAKKVRQYLSQAIGCFLEATQIDSNEWARMHLPGCLWMLSKDGVNGSLCQIFEKKATLIPSWMWLPWIPQLLTSLYRRECLPAKSILMRLARDYPQAVYYPLRVFYLERRDIDRSRLGSPSNSHSQVQTSVVHAEELVTALRRSHACLWSYLEPILEELIVKFRPSNEEDLLATIVALIDRSEFGKIEHEKDVVMSIWKTLGKIALKYFKPTESSQGQTKKDGRAMKSAAFKDRYKTQFESDFCLTSFDNESGNAKDTGPPLDLPQMVERLRAWKVMLEQNLAALSPSLPLSAESAPLAMFAVGDAPDLWPFSCDPHISDFSTQKCDPLYDLHPTAHSTTSSSAAAALKAASSAAISVASAARTEGVGGSYGGGSSFIEVPGQYVPNTSQTDMRPSPELHIKVLRFGPHVAVDTKHDVNVRRIISFEGSDGKTYKFHLGFAFSHLTRTDERTAQTHFVLDKMLRKNNLSAKAELSVQSQPVVPVAQRLRLISEPECRFTLGEAFRHQSRINAASLQHKFVDDVRLLLANESKGPDNESKNIEHSKRLEVFRNIKQLDGVSKTMLKDYITNICGSPEFLFQFRRMFAQQWAVNCLLQYAFSASDRPPNKVVIDGSTGKALSPEFRISYNHQGCFETVCVPFRLTSNLAHFMGPVMMDGKFVKSVGVAAEAAHSCRHTTDSVYRLLIRDDLVSYFTKGSAKPDAKTVEIEKQLMPSVGRNVATLHARFAECAPSYKLEDKAEPEDFEADKSVRELLRLAELEEEQCRMPASFQGWI